MHIYLQILNLNITGVFNSWAYCNQEIVSSELKPWSFPGKPASIPVVTQTINTESEAQWYMMQYCSSTYNN